MPTFLTICLGLIGFGRARFTRLIGIPLRGADVDDKSGWLHRSLCLWDCLTHLKSYLSFRRLEEIPRARFEYYSPLFTGTNRTFEL